jgi:hypothetical protein
LNNVVVYIPNTVVFNGKHLEYFDVRYGAEWVQTIQGKDKLPEIWGMFL